MAAKSKPKYPQAQNPLILRCHRLMEAFAKSDDERDFYLDRVEGFIIYANLDKTEEELETLEKELAANPDRYCMIPKLTFFETKKIMEGFVNEKVYDIDTKEKLLDIIQSKEAREHFLEFIYDHHTELEKWQQYYQERSRIRIIEWLRNYHFHFVFEEDLDLSTSVLEKLKENLFEAKVPREIEVARKSLTTKAKTYYSNEALNPRPKRGRPPKQAQKVEMEPQITTDIYTTVPAPVRPFLFTPEISSVFDVTFSSKFETGKELIAQNKRSPEEAEYEQSLNNISQKLATLRQLSSKWMEKEAKEAPLSEEAEEAEEELNVLEDLDEEEKILFKKLEERKKAHKTKAQAKKPKGAKKTPPPKTVKKLEVATKKAGPAKKKTPAKKAAPSKKAAPAKKKRIITKKATPEKKPVKKAKSAPAKKKTPAKRPIRKITPKAKQEAKPKKKTVAKKKPAAKKVSAKRPLRKTTKTTKKKKGK